MLPKGVWFQKKKLSDGTIVRYGYFGRGPGTISLGREGTAEFHRKLAEALDRTAEDGTLTSLITRYRQSPDFIQLRPRTKRDYEQQLSRIAAYFGPLSLRAMGSPAILDHIYKWRDSRGGSPRQADYGIQVLSALLGWGCKRGLVTANRAAGVHKLYTADRSEMVWSDEQVASFLATAPEHMTRALILGLETGQREADLLKLPWSAVKDGTIHLRQEKGGRRVVIPVSPRLQRALNAAPRSDSLTVLTNSRGLPWTGNGFRSAFRAARSAAGIEGVRFHDLRGTFVTKRFEDGWTTEEIIFCTGHSIRDVRTLERYTARGQVAESNALMLRNRLWRNEEGSEAANCAANRSPGRGTK